MNKTNKEWNEINIAAASLADLIRDDWNQEHDEMLQIISDLTDEVNLLTKCNSEKKWISGKDEQPREH